MKIISNHKHTSIQVNNVQTTQNLHIVVSIFPTFHNILAICKKKIFEFMDRSYEVFRMSKIYYNQGRRTTGMVVVHVPTHRHHY